MGDGRWEMRVRFLALHVANADTEQGAAKEKGGGAGRHSAARVHVHLRCKCLRRQRSLRLGRVRENGVHHPQALRPRPHRTVVSERWDERGQVVAVAKALQGHECAIVARCAAAALALFLIGGVDKRELVPHGPPGLLVLDNGEQRLPRSREDANSRCRQGEGEHRTATANAYRRVAL